MIQFIRGKPEDVYSECVRLYRSSGGRAVWMEPSPNVRRLWAQLRQLLPQLRELVGGPAMEDALTRHKVAASHLLARLETQMTKEERRQRSALGASLTSHLTHNWYVERPFYDELAALMYELFSRARPRLILPQLHGMDLHTFALIKSIYRLHPDFQLDLVIGYTPGMAQAEVDANGISWGKSTEQVEQLLTLLSALSTSQTWEAPTDVAPDRTEVGVAQRLDVWDDDVDGRAIEALVVAGRPLDGKQVAWVLEAAQRAFAAFDRAAALYFAMNALERPCALNREQAATLHTIASLAAHNRQFSSADGDERFNAFIEHHLRRALKLEEEPERRLCLSYRLAVTLGRRKQDHAVAMGFADQVVEGARRASLPEERRAYQEAWGRNIRAYLHMRQGNFAAAFADGACAFERLAPFTESPSEASRDLSFTRVVLADNMEILSRVARDEEQRESWLRKNFALGEQSPDGYGARFSSHRRVRLFARKCELDIAIRSARQGLEDARGELSLPLSYCYLMDLGGLFYRQGEAQEALFCFEDARDLARQGVMTDERALSTSERFLALAAVRVGRPDEAIAIYQQLLKAPRGVSSTLHAELLQDMAIAAAFRGIAMQAEQWIDQAIDSVSRLGTREAFVSVARAAGVVCQLLGRTREAAEAYRRGRTLVEAPTEDGKPIGAGDRVALLIGLAEVDASNPDAVWQAVRWMPEALQQEPESWWYLPRLLSLLVRSAADGGGEGGATHGALATVLKAASQRNDCGASLERLRAMHPGALLHDSGQVAREDGVR
jgi:tetratricopeptide (TPR) repeat protein